MPDERMTREQHDTLMAHEPGGQMQAYARNDVCPTCGHQGWHMAWCPNGPGPSPRDEAGIGFGRPLSAWDIASRERQRAGAQKVQPPKEGDGS